MGPVRIPSMDLPTVSDVTVLTTTLSSSSVCILPNYDNYITAWAPPTPPEPKLDAIKCPSCGQGNVKKTEIDGIVECAYCGRQFTLRY